MDDHVSDKLRHWDNALKDFTVPKLFTLSQHLLSWSFQSTKTIICECNMVLFCEVWLFFIVAIILASYRYMLHSHVRLHHAYSPSTNNVQASLSLRTTGFGFPSSALSITSCYFYTRNRFSTTPREAVVRGSNMTKLKPAKRWNMVKAKQGKQKQNDEKQKKKVSPGESWTPDH